MPTPYQMEVERVANLLPDSLDLSEIVKRQIVELVIDSFKPPILWTDKTEMILDTIEQRNLVARVKVAGKVYTSKSSIHADVRSEDAISAIKRSMIAQLGVLIINDLDKK